MMADSYKILTVGFLIGFCLTASSGTCQKMKLRDVISDLDELKEGWGDLDFQMVEHYLADESMFVGRIETWIDYYFIFNKDGETIGTIEGLVSNDKVGYSGTLYCESIMVEFASSKIQFSAVLFDDYSVYAHSNTVPRIQEILYHNIYQSWNRESRVQDTLSHLVEGNGYIVAIDEIGREFRQYYINGFFQRITAMISPDHRNVVVSGILFRDSVEYSFRMNVKDSLLVDLNYFQSIYAVMRQQGCFYHFVNGVLTSIDYFLSGKMVFTRRMAGDQAILVNHESASDIIDLLGRLPPLLDKMKSSEIRKLRKCEKNLYEK